VGEEKPSAEDFFTGRFRKGCSYLLYGDDKAGKTTLVMSAAARVVGEGMRVVWVDCGARLYFPRVRQILGAEMLESIYVTQPKTFREQLESVVNIHDYLPSGVGLVVCDDFTYLHRLEISGKPAQDLPIYSSLAFQAALLKDLAVTRQTSVVLVGLIHEIPVLNIAAPVAGRIVSYWSDCVARLQRRDGVREVVEEKPGTGRVTFTLADSGVVRT
jgi:RecA/RadA recombinase